MKAKSALEQLASWNSRIARAKQWQKFYSPNSANQDDANFKHWKEIEGKLQGYIDAATK